MKKHKSTKYLIGTILFGTLVILLVGLVSFMLLMLALNFGV